MTMLRDLVAAAMVAVVATTLAASAQTQGTLAKIKERGKLLAGVKLDPEKAGSFFPPKWKK